MKVVVKLHHQSVAYELEKVIADFLDNQPTIYEINATTSKEKRNELEKYIASLRKTRSELTEEINRKNSLIRTLDEIIEGKYLGITKDNIKGTINNQIEIYKKMIDELA